MRSVSGEGTAAGFAPPPTTSAEEGEHGRVDAVKILERLLAWLEEGNTLDLAHIFSGKPRVGGMSHAAHSMGRAAMDFDLLLGRSFDFLSPDVMRLWRLIILTGRVTALFLGVPCNTYSVLRGRGEGPRRIRGREPVHRLGLPGLSRKELRLLEVHNAIADFAVELALLQVAAGRTVCFENPHDKGELGSPFFSWAARAHCPLWLTPAFEQFIAKVGKSNCVWTHHPQVGVNVSADASTHVHMREHARHEPASRQAALSTAERMRASTRKHPLGRA